MEAVTPGQGADADSMDVVQEVLEPLLSKKNLIRDQFLAGNMNPQMYIPVRILLEHEKMKEIGATEAAIVAAATKSSRLGIDGSQTMVRPLLKSKRNVIILRDMPSDATEAEIRSIFNGAPHGDRLVNVKPEVNNTWFLKFDLDEGTQDIVLWLRSQQFKGQPVNAAIKSEYFLRSFFPLHQASGPPQGQMGMPQQGFPMGRQAEYFGMQQIEGPEGFESVGYPMDAPPPMQHDENDSRNFGDAAGFHDSGSALYAMKGKGGGIQMMGMQAMHPMQMQRGPQPPGFWQPWGARYQPPPIVLPLTGPLSSELEPSVHETAAPSDGGKGKGKGKWRGKGGEEKGGWWEKGDKGEKGWKGKGKADGKAEGKGYSKGKADGKADGKAKGKGYAASSQPEEPARRKGERREPASEGSKKWKPRVEGESSAPKRSDEGSAPLPGRANVIFETVYHHDFRKYDRSQIDQICKAVGAETLSRPEAMEKLGAEVPIFREVPAVELAPAASVVEAES